MFRKILFILFSFCGILLAQNKIGQFDFENNIIDPYGNLTTREWYNGTAENIITYVNGHNGLAGRSSHNNDDGGNDFGVMLPGTFPSSGELYIRWWVKYDSNYWGDCGGIWNVKWLWSEGGNHNELIFQYYSNGNIGIDWQVTQGASWSPGDELNSGSFPYTFGNWMKIEIYFKLSSGSNHYNYDGIQWLKVNDNYIIHDESVSTGVPGQISSPALKATCNCASGHGWWQIDEYEAWDGIPSLNPPPSQVQGIQVTAQ